MMHCQCFQQLGILFKPWTKFARLFFFSCQWNFSIRYRQGMTCLSFSLFYYTDVMYLPLPMRTKLTAWLDLTILKESLTAALTLFLFFSTNFSIAVWICSWVSLSQVTWLFPFDCFVLVRAPFTEFYTDVYIYKFHSPRARITVI